MNLKRLFIIRFAFLVTLLQPTPSAADAKSLYLDVMNALGSICSVLDLGTTVSAKYKGMAEALTELNSDLPPGLSSKDIGDIGEQTIKRELDKKNFDYIEERRLGKRFPDVYVWGQDGSQKKHGIHGIFVEIKNKERLTQKDLEQIKDYAKQRPTIVAVRKGAKISESILKELNKLSKSGVLTVVECAFVF